MKIHEVYPYLIVRRGDAAVKFYKTVFGAVEKFRIDDKGKLGHCELLFGSQVLMLAEEYPELGILGPESHGGTSVGIHLHVDNADDFVARAVAHGATIKIPVHDQPHGERGGRVVDPFGHEWILGHVIKKMTEEEMKAAYR